MQAIRWLFLIVLVCTPHHLILSLKICRGIILPPIQSQFTFVGFLCKFCSWKYEQSIQGSLRKFQPQELRWVARQWYNFLLKRKLKSGESSLWWGQVCASGLTAVVKCYVLLWSSLNLLSNMIRASKVTQSPVVDESEHLLSTPSSHSPPRCTLPHTNSLTILPCTAHTNWYYTSDSPKSFRGLAFVLIDNSEMQDTHTPSMVFSKKALRTEVGFTGVNEIPKRNAYKA